MSIESFIHNAKLTVTPMFIYIGISLELLHIVAILMVIDTITARIRVFLNKEEFSSDIGIRGVAKKGLLVLLVMTVGLVARALDFEPLDINKVFGVMIALYEGESIVGNIESSLRGKKKKERDSLLMLIGLLLDWIGSYYETLFKKLNK